MSTERKPFRREGEDQRRRELVEATLACIAELGMEHTTVREIAIRAGVTPGLIRHYFAGKKELVLAAYAKYVDDVAVLAEQAVEAAGNEPCDRLAAFVTGSLTPPMATMGMSTTWATSYTTRSATGFSAGPERPP